MLKPKSLANKNFLSSLDISSDELFHILAIAKNFKNKVTDIKTKDKVLGLIFDSPLLVLESVFKWQCQD